MKRNAHVRKDGTLSYKKEIRINGRRLTKRFSRLADADKWYAEKKREKELVERGLSDPSLIPNTKISDYAETWMQKRKSQGKPYGSWLSDQERLRKWILPVFGDRILQKVSSQEFEAFLDRLVTKEGLAPTTRNRVRAILHKMYNDARRQALVQVNPVSVVEIWKETKVAFDYWQTIEEAQNYLIHAEAVSRMYFIFAVLALNTGARVGELIALQNQDVDLAKRRIHIWKTKELRGGEICKRTKGGGDRWLGINDEVFAVLSEHRLQSRFGRPNDFVLHTVQGQSIDARAIREQHWKTCKKAGLRKIRLHDLRHTFASHYVMNGGGLHDLQALLGHSSPMMTQRYAHLAPGYLETKAQFVRLGKPLSNVSALKAVN